MALGDIEALSTDAVVPMTLCANATALISGDGHYADVRILRIVLVVDRLVLGDR